MNKEHAKPGDIIEVTWQDEHWLGKKFMVIECPAGPKKAGIGIQPGNAWFMSETGSEQYFQLGYYKIVKLVVPHRDVDTFLKRQLNDNLASIFG